MWAAWTGRNKLLFEQITPNTGQLATGFLRLVEDYCGYASKVFGHNKKDVLKSGATWSSPSYKQLYGFTRGPLNIIGRVKLPVKFRKEPFCVTQVEEFMVVNEDIFYNAIIGNPLLKEIRVITFIYHLSIKFSTHNLIGYLLGCQSESRYCYVKALRTTEQTYKHVLLAHGLLLLKIATGMWIYHEKKVNA